MTLGSIITISVLGIALFIGIIQFKKAKKKLNIEIKNKNTELSTKTEENNKLNTDLKRLSGFVSIESEIESKKKKFNEIKINEK